MRFAATAASAILAMAASVFAQTADFDSIFTPTENQVVPAGSTLDITWAAPAKYAEGTVSISLIGGPAQKQQQPIMAIVGGIPNTAQAYTWTVDASLGDQAVYGIQITLESDPSVFQYSMPFTIEGAEGEAPTDTHTTVIVTSAQGIKTIHLEETTTAETTTAEETTTVKTTTSTSCPPTSTSTSTRAIKTTSSTMVNSTTEATSTTVAPTTIITSTSTFVAPPASTTPVETEPTPTPNPDSAAARLGAGHLALVGALVAGYLAL
jgi:hypothetical protein